MWRILGGPTKGPTGTGIILCAFDTKELYFKHNLDLYIANMFYMITLTRIITKIAPYKRNGPFPHLFNAPYYSRRIFKNFPINIPRTMTLYEGFKFNISLALKKKLYIHVCTSFLFKSLPEIVKYYVNYSNF